MLAVADPNLLVAGFAIGGLALAAFWRFIVWIRDAPVKPDPWDAAVELQLQDAPETCSHCSTPQPANAWFCQHCGRAVGPYNNLMPYLQIFSEGEVLRNSGSRHFRNRPLVKAGYFLVGLSFVPLFVVPAHLGFVPLILVPVYWISLVRNWSRPDGVERTPPG